jgi:hypothetical protein
MGREIESRHGIGWRFLEKNIIKILIRTNLIRSLKTASE